MRTSFHRLGSCSLFLAVALAFGLAAGCGDNAVPTAVCDPACPKGSTCIDGTCTPDAPGADMAVSLDLAATCTPACSGANPYCSADHLCVPCLTDDNCPIGNLCKPSGRGTLCVPGCVDDSRCSKGGASAMKCCGGACTDTGTDAQNCGGCGMACGVQHSSALCLAGVCSPGQCAAGWGDCNKDAKDGCEANLRIDTKNCAMCGAACDYPNAISGCADSCYIKACQFGFDDCNGNVADGCETSVLSDPKNCGGCGQVCAGVPHAKVACQSAACQVTMCDQGFADCDANGKNGCETVVATDKNNCGMCGNVCPQGLACVNGGCTCQQCNIPNAKTKCVNNQCVFDSCLPGFADCNNNLNDGCEVDLTADAKNCSACGMACPQNLPACVNSVCSNAVKCSIVATAYCKAKGWVISPWATAFPNQPGGSIFCVPQGGGAANDCDTCNTYNQLVWKPGAKDACNSPMVLQPGVAYGGHNPCACNANNFNCGAWPMMGCIPD